MYDTLKIRLSIHASSEILGKVAPTRMSLSYPLKLALLKVDLMRCRTIKIPVSCLLIANNTPCHCDSQSNPKLFPNNCRLRTPCGAIRNHYCRQVLLPESCLLIHTMLVTN